MNGSNIPFKPHDPDKESDLQAAYRIAGALTHGGLSWPEMRMVVHQWALHMKETIKEPKSIPAVRRHL